MILQYNCYIVSNRVLRKTESINEGGEVLWDLALCLLLGWIVIYLCLIKGVKSSGKVQTHADKYAFIGNATKVEVKLSLTNAR